jgi:hypothetical protein
MKSLVKITERIVEKKISRLGAIQTHIFMNWHNISGQYSDITFPFKIKFIRKKDSQGQIIIKVQNGFGPEIQHATPFLLNQINARFGYKAITKMKIIQTELGYFNNSIKAKSSENSIIDKENMISDILPDGQLKLAMQRFELSRKKNNLED